VLTGPLCESTNGAIYWKHSSDGTTWPKTSVDLGGNATSDPAALETDGQLAVYARSSDGALWWTYTTDGGTSWSSWSSLGGQLLTGTGPGVCTLGSVKEIFVTGTDNALYKFEGVDVPWKNLGGSLTSSPAAESQGPGYLGVLARGSDGALWHIGSVGGSWGSWSSLGGELLAGTSPTAGYDLRDPPIARFVTGTDHALWWWVDGWGSVGGYLTSSPAAIMTALGISVFARGSDNGLWEITLNMVQNGNEWSGWTAIGGI